MAPASPPASSPAPASPPRGWVGPIDLGVAPLKGLEMTARPLSHDEAHALVGTDPELDAALQQVAVLDFTLLKRKLAHERKWTAET